MTITNRRGFFKSAASAATAATIPSVAQADCSLPIWWSKVTSGGTELLPAWQDTELNREIARAIEHLHSLLLASAPDGVDHLRDISWAWFDGKPESIWAVGRAGEGNLWHYRPEHEWVERTPLVVEVSMPKDPAKPEAGLSACLSEWRSKSEQWGQATEETPEHDALFAELERLTETIMVTPAKSPSDLAAKIRLALETRIVGGNWRDDLDGKMFLGMAVALEGGLV